jgi:iron complex outermembrane receptor protein
VGQFFGDNKSTGALTNRIIGLLFGDINYSVDDRGRKSFKKITLSGVDVMTHIKNTNQNFNLKARRTYGKSILAAAVSLALFSSGQVLAKTNVLMEEVMVTAQKKSSAEAVQDVPIAISAYSGDKVEAMFAVTLTDIGTSSPNTSLAEQGTVPHTGNFIIRGMGTTGQSIPSSDPAVGVVQDGMPYGLIYGVVTDLFDLESIEILRGPQGTLFGRNVTGGAVVMRTTRPSDDFSGKVKATIGSHGQRDVSAVVTGPISDSVNGKIAVISKDRDGLWFNTTTGGHQGASETLIVRPAITFKGEGYDLTAIAESASIKGDGMAARSFYLDTAFLNDTVLATGVESYDIDPWADNTTETDTKGDLDLSWSSLVVEHNLDLWGGTLTTIASVRDLDQDTWGDIDGAAGTIRFEFAEGSGISQTQKSFESRWSGNVNESVSLTAGINLFDQEYTYRERRLLVDAVERPSESTIDHSTFGVFAQAEYDVSEDITLILGGRYSSEDKDAAIGVIGDPGGVGSCSSIYDPSGATVATRTVDWSDCRQVFNDSASWSNFSPKLGVNWTLNEDMLAYASLSRGFRSGGYNVRFTDATVVTTPDNPTSTPGPYNEETVDAFEVGFKSMLLDGRVKLNMALFFNEIDDMQKAANNQSGVQTVFNAASATIQGFEVDSVVAVSDYTTFEFGYGYTDAEYDSADYLVEKTGRAADEFKFQMVPERTTSMALTHERPVGDRGYITLRGSYSYIDSVASDDFNFLMLPQYELFDASVSFTSIDESLKVAVFGRNLKDEVYSHFGFDNSGGLGSKTVWLAPPRTYGVELTYNF